MIVHRMIESADSEQRMIVSVSCPFLPLAEDRSSHPPGLPSPPLTSMHTRLSHSLVALSFVLC